MALFLLLRAILHFAFRSKISIFEHMRVSFSLLFFCTFFSLSSQEITKQMQLDSLDKLTQTQIKPLVKQLYAAKISDQQRTDLNKKLIPLIEGALSIPHTFDYAFDSLQKDIGIVYSPDDFFRIVHWTVPKNDGTFEYYGFLQVKTAKDPTRAKQMNDNKLILYPLTDKSAEIKNPENSILDHNKWFGCLYYKVIVQKTKAKNYYTLLGFDGNDKFSRKKIIDVLTFDKTSKPKFGADIFVFPKKYPKRVVFEYSSSCVMTLRYSSKKDSIVFDHLAPTQPSLEGQFQYYCGDMSYDGLGFKRGKWSYGKDLNAINDKDENDKFYGNPKDISPGHDQSEEVNPGDKKIKKDKKKDNLKEEKNKK